MADGGGVGASLGSLGGASAALDDPFLGSTMGSVSVIPGLTADPSVGGGIGDPFGGNTMGSGGSWLDRNWGDIKKGLGAAQSAAKSAGDVNKSQKTDPMKLGNPGQSQAYRGQGQNLNQLVQLLLQRQNSLFPGGGGSSGQPMPPPRTQGLLGF
jgi:hypothetical protein